MEMDETVSLASAAINNQRLNNQQAFLDGQHSYLRGKTTVSFPLTVGQQFYPVVSPVNGTALNKLIDLDRARTLFYINYSNFRYQMRYGISQPEYNIYNSAFGVAGVPCMKWDLKNNQTAVTDPAANYPGSGAAQLTYTGLQVGGTYSWVPGVQELSLTYNGNTYTQQDVFTVVAGVTTATVTGAANGAAYTGQLNAIGLMLEVWPIPSVPQTLELEGLLPLTIMENDADTCVIDDLLLVLFTAAEYLSRAGAGDAQAKITKAKAHLDTLKASYPSRYETFNMSGGHLYIDGFTNGKGRPVIAVSGPASQ